MSPVTTFWLSVIINVIAETIRETLFISPTVTAFLGQHFNYGRLLPRLTIYEFYYD